MAVRSFAPLFCALIAAFMLQMYPAAAVTGLARELFSPTPPYTLLLAIGGLAFLLPAWAAPRVTLGLHGWLRHLSCGETRNRRGVAVALLIVQLPAFTAVLVLATVARMHGLSVWRPVWVQLAVLACAGAVACLPVKRRWLTVPAASIAGALAAVGSWRSALGSVVLLLLSELAAGPIAPPARRHERPTRLPFGFSICRRALGWRGLAGYAAAAVPAVGSWLFVTNNELAGELARGAYRFGFALAATAFLATASATLAVRRPVWPWARSLPWSSRRRVLEDALFLAVAAIPILLPCLMLDRAAAAAVLLVLPALALRATGAMRTVPQRRLGVGRFGPEAFLASAILALVPWAQWVAPAAAVAALEAGRRAEMNQKVTRWLELHYAAAGDSQSWSGG